MIRSRSAAARLMLLSSHIGPGSQSPIGARRFLSTAKDWSTPNRIATDVLHRQAGLLEQLAREGITAGCGNGKYCPNVTVTRDQMAVFLVRTFGLP